jgi:hypothetical protein
MLRKRAFSIAAATSAAAVMTVAGATSSHAEGVGPGGGGQPGPRTPPTMLNTYTFPAGDVCPFQTTIADVVNQSYGRTFPSGETLFTGQIKERITNDETGKTVYRNISGPGNSTFGPNGEWILTLTGISIFWIEKDAGDATGTLNEGLFIGHGPIVYVDLVLTRAPASYENLCETVG